MIPPRKNLTMRQADVIVYPFGSFFSLSFAGKSLFSLGRNRQTFEVYHDKKVQESLFG